MKSSMFVFGSDLAGEGYDVVLDNLGSRAGVSAVSFSATYHNARDIFPHNPAHRVYRHEGDVAWFSPNVRSYPDGMAPPLARDADGVDMLARLTDEATSRGLETQAWTIYSHNSRLTMADSSLAVENAYGDRYMGDLCPANQGVQDYFVALTADVCRYPVTRLLAEALHFRPFEHGDHHERYLIPVPGRVRAALGLCFCVYCMRNARELGIDAVGFRAALRNALEAFWRGDGLVALDASSLAADLARYSLARVQTVTGLTREIASVTRSAGVGLSFLDHAGAMPHVMTDLDPAASPQAAAIRLGVDPLAISREVDELTAMAYVETAEQAAATAAWYRDSIDPRARLSCVLRPLDVDCSDRANLAAKVGVLRSAGIERIDFYHYAMMPLERLDWIGDALD